MGLKVKDRNELLKLRLEVEHKMTMSETSGLPAEIERQWLNSIYNFEKQYQEASQIRAGCSNLLF